MKKATINNALFHVLAPTLVCKCSEVIMKSSSDGMEKIRAKIIILKENQVFAVCKGCNSEVEIPLTRINKCIESIPANPGPKLYLEK